MRHHPDDCHALVLNRILSLPKGSPESHAAHADYQQTRLGVIRPKVLAQAALLRLAIISPPAVAAELDLKALEIDVEIARAWLAVDSRIGDVTQEAA